MIEQAGGRVAGCAFLIELVALGGAARIAQYKTMSLLKF
jgi:adenine/guanine phosphoribosyltransferase-like PRPP-binding protein